MIQTSRYARHLSAAFFPLGLLAFAVNAQEVTGTAYEWNCSSLSGNARSDETICAGFEFSDGTNQIAAGLAMANKFDFDGSRLRLSDGVQLSFGTTEIQANEALLSFEAGELVLGELSGNPVVMSDYIEERDTPVRGTAEEVSYDSKNGTVRLNGQATLVIGENEVMGCDWIYDFNEKNYSGGGTEDCGGVLFRLAPPEESNDIQDQAASP